MANDAQTKIGNLISLLSLIISIISLSFTVTIVSVTVWIDGGILTEEMFNKRIAELKYVATTTAACACGGGTPGGGTPGGGTPGGGTPGGDTPGGGTPGADNPTASRIEVLFDNARLQPKKGGRSLTESSPGIALTAPQGAELDKLAAALLACAEPGPSVRLKLQGYSSTRAFVDETGTRLLNSDELNVQAANLRAEAVKGRLASQGIHPDGGFDVRYRPWETFADMARPFKDSGFRGAAQEQLNRVVFVELQDAGACQRDT